MTNRAESKINQFPKNLELILLLEKDLKIVFDYVKNKYGKNYIKLYDNKIIKLCNDCNGYIYKKNKSGYCVKCYNKRFNKLKNHKKNIIKKESRKTKKCLNCDTLIYKDSVYCKNCYAIKQRKVERPSYEQLIKDIKDIGYMGTGRKYNVSDNSIRKWKKFYEK